VSHYCTRLVILASVINTFEKKIQRVPSPPQRNNNNNNIYVLGLRSPWSMRRIYSRYYYILYHRGGILTIHTIRISYHYGYTMTLRIIIISVVVFRANQYQLKWDPPSIPFRWKYNILLPPAGTYYFNKNMMYYP